jgi:hypothetical protein
VAQALENEIIITAKETEIEVTETTVRSGKIQSSERYIGERRICQTFDIRSSLSV